MGLGVICSYCSYYNIKGNPESSAERMDAPEEHESAAAGVKNVALSWNS